MTSFETVQAEESDRLLAAKCFRLVSWVSVKARYVLPVHRRRD